MSAVLDNIHRLKADPLEEAVETYLQAKRAETLATAARIAAEERILTLKPAPEEGSATTALDNGFKLTLTGKLIYKVDNMEGLLHAVSHWPASMQPIKTEVKLDETGAKFLRANERDAWEQIARFITVKPAKTAVAVKA